MKANLLSAVLVFSLLSCESDFLENGSENLLETDFQTKAVNVDFDPIVELRGIPVQIVNIGNTVKKYLQADKRDRGNVYLTTKGDNVANQKWNIDGYILARSAFPGGACNIYLAEETSTYAGPIATHLFLQPEYPQNSQSKAIVSTGFSPYLSCNYEFIPGTPYFYLSNVYGNGIYASSSSNKLYLQSSTTTGSDVKYFQTKNQQLARWSAQPIGEYEVVNIQYLKKEEDIFQRDDQLLTSATIENDRDVANTYRYTVSGSYTESTSSSVTKGVSVSVTESIKIGLPFIGADGSVSSTQTTSKTWAYGKSDSQTKTVTHTVDIPVPARTKTRMEAYMVSHTGTVSFVATLRKTTDLNVQFRVTGKWAGVTTSEFYCKTWDEATGKELGTYSFPLTVNE